MNEVKTNKPLIGGHHTAHTCEGFHTYGVLFGLHILTTYIWVAVYLRVRCYFHGNACGFIENYNHI